MGTSHRNKREKRKASPEKKIRGNQDEKKVRNMETRHFIWIGFLVIAAVIVMWTYCVAENDQSRNLDELLKYYNVTHSLSKIDRRSKLSLQEYMDVYDAKFPVLITDVVPLWPAFNWTKDFFLKNYGGVKVTVKTVEGDLSKAESLALPISMFIQKSHSGSFQTWTYLEDEMFITQRPELLNDIGKVAYLEEDYFELFPAEIKPWNAMLLWGSVYSRSPLHIDPYNWTGTNAVLMGTKRWKMYPPGQDDYLYVINDQKSGFPLDCYKYNSPIDAYDVNLDKYPKFQKTKWLEFDQYAGELLLIPTGWFHQAFNVEETMAISSQVMNTNNYKIVLEEILKAGNFDDINLPIDYASLLPEKQVETLMSVLPGKILEKGRQVTESVLNQLKYDELYQQQG